MSVNVQVNDFGFRKLLQEVAGTFKPEAQLKAIGGRAVKWINTNFEQQGKPVGGWTPLKESTIARRRQGPRPGKADMILNDTGLLKGSFERLELTNRYVVVGTRSTYAKYHQQDGGTSSRIPRRSMLMSQAQGRELAVSLLRAAIDNVKAKR